jgi:hypothetical protein
MQGEVDPLPPGSHLNPLTQSRGYFGAGQFPAGPSGPGIAPDDTWKVGSNSPAKSGVFAGILGIPVGLIPVIGFAFALGFGLLAVALGGFGVWHSRRLAGRGGIQWAVLAIAIGVGLIVWKLIEGVGPAVVVS